VHKQILINAELKTAERKGQETESTGRNLLRRRRSALDCSAIQEKKKEKEEDGLSSTRFA